MRREDRQLTRAKWKRTTSERPMMRQLPPPNKSQPGEQPELRDGQDAGRVFEGFYTQRDHGETKWRTGPKR